MEHFNETLLHLVLFLVLYFEVFLVYTYIEERDFFRKSPPDTGRLLPYPSVSVIVPVWNEELTLKKTVESLLGLDYPKDKLEVIVVNDGSTDTTPAVMESFKNHPQVQLLHKENGGKYTALNLALAHAKNDLIGCLDADSFVSKDALLHMIPYFDNPETMAVTPAMKTIHSHEIIARIQSTEYLIGEMTRKIFSRLGGIYVTPGPFSIYRKKVFSMIGEFTSGFNTEDMEMAMRMQSNRMKIDNAHEAVVFTTPPRSLYPLYRQRVRWVTGFLKNTLFSYSHLIFRRKYGNLGMLTLPFSLISVFIAIYFTMLFLYYSVVALYEKLLKISVVGVEFGVPRFDWYALDFGFEHLIIYFLVSVTIYFIYQGTMLVNGKFTIKRDIFYFLAFYGFIAPLWLMRSVYNLISSREATWR
jgi:cellulose synthase/poly-beta-1,6-N-acetylglucosamine synthase-like glycosyltransferase